MNVYRLLLRLAPRRLRDKHGREMEEMFRAQLADARGRGRVAVAADLVHAPADMPARCPRTSVTSGASVDASACRAKGDRS